MSIIPECMWRREITPHHAQAQLSLWHHQEIQLFGVIDLSTTPAGAIVTGHLYAKNASEYLLKGQGKEIFNIPAPSLASVIYMTLDLRTGEGGIEMTFDDCIVTVTDHL
jgi:hypothetical protein